MNATTAHLMSNTVVELKTIAKLMGLKGYSRLNKGELVLMIFCERNILHAKALEMNYTDERTTAVIKAEGKVSHMNFPAVSGEVVTEAHVKICKERGHASYSKNGVEADFCPRCGDLRELPQIPATQETDSVEKDDTSIDTFIKQIMTAIQPIAKRAQRYQNEAIESDNPEADQWVQLAKDTMRLMGDIEWMRHYRNPSTIYS